MASLKIKHKHIMVSKYYYYLEMPPTSLLLEKKKDHLKPFIPFHYENPTQMFMGMLLIHTGEQALLYCVTGILPLPSVS